MTDRVDEACKAHTRGWALTPLRGKVPLLDKWTTLPKPALEDVVAWAREGNIGLRAGQVSGVFIVDEDTAKGGKLPQPLPPTPTVRTGSGGMHYYLKAPVFKLGNSSGKLASGVDTRGDGGQVVYVGSIHPDTGKPYEWVEGLSPDDVELAEIPEWVMLAVKPPKTSRTKSLPSKSVNSPYVLAALTNECAAVAASTEPGRNHQLNRSAFSIGQYAASGAIGYGISKGALLDAALTSGLPDCEARKTIDSGFRAALACPKSVPERPERNGNGKAHATAVQATEEKEQQPQEGEQPEQQRELRCIDLASLYDHPVEPVPWIIDGLLADRDICVIGGEPGSGKSILLMALALALSTGIPFLGIKTPRHRSTVLYVDEENNEKIARRRLGLMLRGIGVEREALDSVQLVYCVENSISLDNEDSALPVYAAIDRCQPQWIFLDSLVRFHNRDENSNSEMSRFFTRVLKPMTARSSAGLVVLHHLAKPSKDRGNELGHRLRGASDIRAMVDQLWGIEGDHSGRKRTMRHDKCRWGEPHAPLSIEYTETKEKATVTAKTEHRAIGDLILDVIRDAGRDGVDRQDIIEAVSDAGYASADRMTSSALKDLVDGGKAHSQKEGRKARYYIEDRNYKLEGNG